MTLIELTLALIVVLLLGLIILCWMIYRAMTVMGFMMDVQNKHIAHIQKPIKTSAAPKRVPASGPQHETTRTENPR